MEFAEVLATERKAVGLTQEQLAKAAGLSLDAVKSYETGRNRPSADALFSLCEALGVSCEKFSRAERPRKKPAKKPKQAKGK